MFNMRITSRVDDMPIMDSIRQHLEKKFSSLERYSNHIIDGEFILDEIRGRFVGEVILNVKGGTITAKATGKSPLDVIDELKDKVKVQLNRYEEKMKSRR